MKVGFLQTSPEFGQIEFNVERVVRRLEGLKADLIVLPELFSTGYQFKSKKEVASFAEEIPGGYAANRLIETAKKRGIFIVAGIAERDGRGFYNSSILVGPKGLIGVYRKAHLFCNEKKFFTPGDTPFGIYTLGPSKGNVKVGMMICFDWLFPEVARTLALKGADIICHPSNLVLPHCPQAMITRCLENRVFAITANRVGVEDRIKGERLKFIGQSEIVQPDGKVLYRASGNKEETKVIEIDPKIARDKRVTSSNDIFNDRREEFYGV